MAYIEAMPLKTSKMFPYLRNQRLQQSYSHHKVGKSNFSFDRLLQLLFQTGRRSLAYISDDQMTVVQIIDIFFFLMPLNASLMLCCVYAIRGHRYIRKSTKASLSSKMVTTENIININQLDVTEADSSVVIGTSKRVTKKLKIIKSQQKISHNIPLRLIGHRLSQLSAKA